MRRRRNLVGRRGDFQYAPQLWEHDVIPMTDVFDYPAFDDEQRITEAFYLQFREATNDARAVAWHPTLEVFGVWKRGETAHFYSMNNQTGALRKEGTVTLQSVLLPMQDERAPQPFDVQKEMERNLRKWF